MAMVIVALILAAVATFPAACSDDLGDVNVICLNSTTYKMRVEVEDIYITTPAFVCPAGQVCDERRKLPCVPAWDGTNIPFECTQSGVFSDPDPCSSTFYLCLNTIFHGFFKKNLSCGPYKTYNERKEDCEIKPLECNNPFSWRTAFLARLADVPTIQEAAIVPEINMTKSTTTILSTTSATVPTTPTPSTTSLSETLPTTLSTNTVPTTATTTTVASTSTTSIATPITSTSAPTSTTTAPRPVVPISTPGPVFVCPHSGKFAVPNSCNEYYICRKIFWTLSYFKATCYGNLQFSSLKQKCVPSWLSDCGIANAEVPWWLQHRELDDQINSSEEDW